jgi:hypothetical protein
MSLEEGKGMRFERTATGDWGKKGASRKGTFLTALNSPGHSSCWEKVNSPAVKNVIPASPPRQKLYWPPPAIIPGLGTSTSFPGRLKGAILAAVSKVLADTNPTFCLRALRILRVIKDTRTAK